MSDHVALTLDGSRPTTPTSAMRWRVEECPTCGARLCSCCEHRCEEDA